MKNFKKTIVNGSMLLVFISFFVIVMMTIQAFAADNCRKTYPNPVIKIDKTDAEGRVYIPVTNRSVYDNEMFRKAPELPACGANANSSRTWVDIYNADTNTKLYGFCGLGSKDDLKNLWFKPTTFKGRAYIIINDRACQKSYKSNIITWGPQDNCRKTYPNPVIKVDHKDVVGRVFIPVTNRSAYDNEMFRKAPDYPACGANTNSARTWVNVYNADTNAVIYGFCGFGSKDDLKGIWFKPSVATGKTYIIFNDRACQKNYKSNIIPF